jgi:arginyl-tRNA synthetase
MLKSKIRDDILKTVKKLNFEINPNFTVEVPNNKEHGDFSTNVALISAKLNKMKPRKLAEKLAEQLTKKRCYHTVSIAGPGFINFIFSNSVLHQELIQVLKSQSRYGRSNYGDQKKVLLEFVSANPTGPLNVVNARAAAYGDTLANVFQYVGFNPFKEYYVNDFGNQVDILAESMEIRYRELHGEVIDEFPPEAYHGEYIKELAANLNTIDGTKLFHISEKDRLERMKNFALEEIHNSQVESLTRFDVVFDNWMSEKKLRAEGAIEEALSYLTEANCTYEKEDAIWFNSTEYGDEKDRVLMKADGNTTYFVPDIAYHITKFQRDFDIMIDVLGPDHHGYVPRLLAALRALKFDTDKLEIVYLQHINLFSQGEKVKMSKRLGKLVTMDDLIDEVGKDTARYFFIDRKPSSHMNFDLELAKKHSNENPVYYIQYAHARISSILKLSRKEKFDLLKMDKKLIHLLHQEEELQIIKKLLEFPSMLNSIADTREPHRLSAYTHELAGMFHKYYAKQQIYKPKFQRTTSARLYLITAIRTVLRIALRLMGISAPEKMSKNEQEETDNQ